MNFKKLLPLALILTSFSTLAETRWFEVEVLLFERNIDMNKFIESIPSEHKDIDVSNRINLIIPQYNKNCIKNMPCLHQKSPVLMNEYNFNKNTKFTNVEKSELKLTKQRLRLNKHDSFKPLFHGAWRMPISSQSVQLPLHIFAGENFSLPEMTRLVAVKTELDASNDNDELTEDQKRVNAEIKALKDTWAIDGNLKISLDHYLNVDSQFLVRREISEDESKSISEIEVLSDENGVEIIKESDQIQENTQHTILKEMLFDQKRRLKSEEIHYFDHPLMGMIIQIRKIE